MKCFFKKAARCTAMITVMTFAVTVFGADMRYYRSATVFAEDTTEAVDENNNEVNSLIMTDCFDELTLYRWTRVTQYNYPTDSNWHPSLLFVKSGTYAINPVAPDDIWMGASSPNIKGAHRFGGANEANFMANYPYTFDYNNSYCLKVSTQPDWESIYPQVANGSTFYTNSDYNCLYLKWDGTDDRDKNNGLDGQRPPRYLFRMSNGKGGMSDYTFSAQAGPTKKASVDLSTGSSTADTILTIVVPIYGLIKWGTEKATEHTYYTTSLVVSGVPNGSEPSTVKYSNIMQSQANLARGTTWRIFQDVGTVANHRIMTFGPYILSMPYIRSSQWKGLEHYGTANNGGEDDATWYVGEKLRFTSLKDNTVVSENSILQIQNTTYIDENNEEQIITGVMIPEGETLTINKGGILSIEGTLINNGTIINNGGTIIVKNGGNITSFLVSGQKDVQGCGAIKCLGGDIIIQEGGAVYAGLNDGIGNIVDFHLDDSSTLINQGLLVYGSMRLGDAARVELYDGSKTYGSFYMGASHGHALSLRQFPMWGIGELMYEEKQVGFSELPSFYQDGPWDSNGNFIAEDYDNGYTYGELEGMGDIRTYCQVSKTGGIEVTLHTENIKKCIKNYENSGMENVALVLNASRFPRISYYTPFAPIEQKDILTYSNGYFRRGEIDQVTQLSQLSAECVSKGSGMYKADGVTVEPSIYKATGAGFDDPGCEVTVKELGI